MPYTSPGLRLQAWLDRLGYTHLMLATELHVTRGQVSSVILGRRRPSLTLAFRIEQLTGIPATSWLSSTAPAGATSADELISPV